MVGLILILLGAFLLFFTGGFLAALGLGIIIGGVCGLMGGLFAKPKKKA